MAAKLRDEFIKLLEEDKEFRYTVAGYLGLSEILKRLDRLEEGQNKLWEEVRGLREEQNKLWEEVRNLREGQNKLWEEVRSLREGQNKLWEGQNKLWEEVRNLSVEQSRLRKYVTVGFTELRNALGVTFEMHAAAYLQLVLEEMGFEAVKVERKLLIHDGEIVEVNLFCEEPLVVGEVTVAVRTAQEAVNEVSKLLEKVEVVVERYGRAPVLTVLSVGRASPEAAGKLREEMSKRGFRLVLGREIEEALQV